jgi:hypothetical protein
MDNRECERRMSVQLTPEQLNDLRQLEDVHKTIKQEIERAKEAGLDMSEYEAKYAALENVRAGLLKVYGEKKPRRAIG